MSDTPIFDTIQTPADLKRLSVEDLETLAEEVRQDMIRSVAKTGGHLGSSLGVLELTVALHHVFDAPEDKIIWDVGHQSYAHKMLTGRRHAMDTLRQGGGLAGFTKRSESEYDAFGTGHSSTSISAGLGMAVGRDLKGTNDNEVIAVIGDGSMSAGMAYEAMNNAGAIGSKLLVILNDNDMSIAPPVGAMSDYFSRLISSHPYLTLRSLGKQVGEKVSEPLARVAGKLEKYAKGLAAGGTLFEELGFYYVGPVDGHNLKHLIPVLHNIKNENCSRPILLHVVTQKGKGFSIAESAKDKCHSIGRFDPDTGLIEKNGHTSFTDVFAENLIAQAEKDENIVAITAAMPSGTGINKFAERFPERTFDVGIAEQHAVTFAAGLACEGIKPFVALYSTFLQRAYDQIVHDVVLQKLPVRFAIDRAGYVGADGPTHEGSFDIAFLMNLPGMILMCPSDEVELGHAVATAASIDDAPSAFRYPRGGIRGVTPEVAEVLPIGKGRIIKQGMDIAVLSLGTCLQDVMKASDVLAQEGINITVADARFAKPFDRELLLELAKSHRTIITIEDGRSGGFGAHVMEFLATENVLHTVRFRPLTMPDIFIGHNTQAEMYKEAGLNWEGLVDTVKQYVSAYS